MRRPRRRWIIAGVVGILLAAIAIWVCRVVYDPFATDIDDVRVVLPSDLDWMAEVRDLPTLLDELDTGAFYTALDADPAFQRFLARPDIRTHPTLVGLRQMLRAMTEGDIELPFDLEPAGDVTGRQIAIGGYVDPIDGNGATDDNPSTPSIFVAFKPDSALALVGANAFLSETLTDWFVADALPDARFEHLSHAVEVTMPVDGVDQTFAMARIENVVLVGTDSGAISRAAIDARNEGLPVIAARRYEPDWVFDDDDDATTAIRLTVRRATMESFVDIRRDVVEPLAGPDLAGLVERALPEIDEGDLHVRIAWDETLDIRLMVPCRPRNPSDLLTRAPAVRESDLRLELDTVVQYFPFYSFAHAHLSMSPSRVLRFLTEDADLMDRDKERLWSEEIAARMPSLSGDWKPGQMVPALGEMLGSGLRDVFDGQVVVVPFRIERDEPLPDATPGLAFVFHVKNRDRLLGLIDEIDKVAPGSRVFERYDEGDDVLFHVADKRWMDDKESTDPGFALIGDWFVFSNWFRMLLDRQKVVERRQSGFPALATVRESLDPLPDDTRATVFVDIESLYEYLDQAKAGWVEDRTTVTDYEMIIRRQNLNLEAKQRKIPLAQRDRWIRSRFDAWLQRLRRERNPAAIRREIEEELAPFRTGFDWLRAVLAQTDDTLRLDLRLAARSR